MRTRLGLALLALVGFLSTTTLLATSAQAAATSSTFATKLVDLINTARGQHGLSALMVTSGTSTVAGSWTEHLAAAQALSHNPNLAAQLETHGSANWTAYGENVGVGPTSSAQTLFDAYMNSPEHRANILGASYRYLGIGVVFTGSRAWNTLDFVDHYQSTTRTTSTTTTKPATTTRSITAPSTVRRPAAAPRRIVHLGPHRVLRHSTPHPAVSVKAIASTMPVVRDVAAPVGPVALPAAPEHHAPSRSPVPYAVAVWVLVMAASRFLMARLQSRG